MQATAPNQIVLIALAITNLSAIVTVVLNQWFQTRRLEKQRQWDQEDRVVAVTEAVRLANTHAAAIKTQIGEVREQAYAAYTEANNVNQKIQSIQETIQTDQATAIGTNERVEERTLQLLGAICNRLGKDCPLESACPFDTIIRKAMDQKSPVDAGRSTR